MRLDLENMMYKMLQVENITHIVRDKGKDNSIGFYGIEIF